MNFISFENALTQHAGITVIRKQRSFAVKRGNTVSANYSDDALSTVAASLLVELRALYPKLQSFKHCPMVSMGTGFNLGDFLDNFDYEQFEGLFSSMQSDDLPAERRQFYDDAIANYNHAKTMVGGASEFIGRSVMLETMFQIFLKQRQEPLVLGEGEPLPHTDLMQVICGEKGSVIPGPGRKLPEMIIEQLLKVHPEGKVTEEGFIINAPLDIFFLIGGEAKRPTWGEILADLDAKDFKTGAHSMALVQATPGAPVDAGTAHPLEASSCDDVAEGVAHVERFACEDLNRVNRDEALYGGPEGKAAYMRLSKAFRDILASKIHQGEALTPEEAIRRIADAMVKAGLKGTYSLACILAGGRFVAWKGNYEFSDKWVRK